jgi:hypothetical protein
MLPTSVTDKNRTKFYQQVYPVVNMTPEELIDISKYKTTKVIFDSAGWFYQQHFANEKIVRIENIQSCKNFNLTRQQFDHVFADNQLPVIAYPNCVLILDHAPFLKYKSPQQIKNILVELEEKIKYNVVCMRLNLQTLNDNRLTDRVETLVKIIPESFVTVKLHYQAGSTFTLELKKKTQYGKH